MSKRTVTDILDIAGPVAFIQEPGGSYTCVCPWCAQDIDTLTLGEITYGKLYDLLFKLQFPHMTTCAARNLTEMQVQI